MLERQRWRGRGHISARVRGRHGNGQWTRSIWDVGASGRERLVERSRRHSLSWLAWGSRVSFMKGVTGTDLYSRDFVLSRETEPTAVRETGLGAVLQLAEGKGGLNGGEGPGPGLDRGLP